MLLKHQHTRIGPFQEGVNEKVLFVLTNPYPPAMLLFDLVKTLY